MRVLSEMHGGKAGPKEDCRDREVQASTGHKQSKGCSSWLWKLTAPRAKWEKNWTRALLWRCCRSHKLGFEKALSQKLISQGSLCSEVLIRCVNDSTCVPLGEWRRSKEERGSWTHYLRPYLLSFPQQCLPNRWHKPSSRQKKDNFYALLKFLTLPPPRPCYSLPDWMRTLSWLSFLLLPGTQFSKYKLVLTKAIIKRGGSCS